MSKTIAIAKSHTASLLSALFIAANIGLPHLFHLIPGGGVMFLPIYFFTAFAAVSYGKWSGILTGVMSPLLGFLIFGAPKAFMIPDMVLKGVLLSYTLHYFLTRAKMTFRDNTIAQVIAIPTAVLTAWMAAGLLEMVIGKGEAAFLDFFTGIPGLIMMTIAGWLALFFNRQIAK